MSILNEAYVTRTNIMIPKLGFGTWQIKDGPEAYQAVLTALEYGYRHLDTAEDYENEASVGQAIIDSKIPRDQLFITSKLPSHIKTYSEAKTHFQASLKRLKLSYLDLYLIHAPWPWANIGQDCEAGNIEVWKAFIELRNEGKIKAIGVSNFEPKHLKNIIKATNVIPDVNQIAYFIGNRQEKTMKFCHKFNILVEAYSPFATGKLLNNEVLVSLANKYGVSVARLCLKYCLLNGTLPLPKSTHPKYIIDNTLMSFDIDEFDMKVLNKIDDLRDPKNTRKWLKKLAK
ncbi:MAG: aldo/keto reductase [Erysipelotrichaceae bacterium]|jgi:diketogulonate reductase-like aldo/keto reductase|nr:aldo/keto reductase [Erysipelotrichaceae bacterium]